MFRFTEANSHFGGAIYAPPEQPSLDISGRISRSQSEALLGQSGSTFVPPAFPEHLAVSELWFPPAAEVKRIVQDLDVDGASGNEVLPE